MKGGNFEREIAKELSLWYSKGKRDDLIWRTHGSGGRATQRAKSDKDTKYQHGDLTFSDPCVKELFDVFNFELKTGYSRKTKKKSGNERITNWCILDLIDSKQKVCIFEEMWRQAERDAKKSKRIPILIFRRPMKSPCIVVNSNIFIRLFVSLSLSKENKMPSTHRVSVHLSNGKLVSLTIISLSSFLEWAVPKDFISIGKGFLHDK
jgi:hypothetical protein